MKKLLKKRLNNEKGLTLVELLAVIVILGIIAAIAIPSVGGIIQGTREKAVIADAQNALAAASLYFLENSSSEVATVSLEKHTVTVGGAEVDGGLVSDYLESKGSLSTATITKVAAGNHTIVFSGLAGDKKVENATTDAHTKDKLSKLTKAELKALVK